MAKSTNQPANAGKAVTASGATAVSTNKATADQVAAANQAGAAGADQANAGSTIDQASNAIDQANAGTAAGQAAADEAATDNATADQVIADQAAANQAVATSKPAKIAGPSHETIARVAKHLEGYGLDVDGDMRAVGDAIVSLATHFEIAPDDVMAISHDGRTIVTIDGRKLTVTE